MFKKKNESGRSMVEMLGVLAIVGVLSIGGIAGYTLAMRKYRANQVVDALNKFALILYGACQKAVMDGKVDADYMCDSKDLPTYEETGLPPINEIYKFDNLAVDMRSRENHHVDFNIYFHDHEVCKATASITGYNSGPCNPRLDTDFYLK